MKTTHKPKVLLAMSGGVDSSVAALLLKKQGFEIIGAFMKNYSNTKNNMGECAWRGERRVAIKIAAKLKIPLITLDFEKEYKKLVVDEMFKLYRKGITPNPDIDCNEKIKFPLLLKAKEKLKCDFLATGHYVRIKKNSSTNTFELHRAKDESKDQSYFLYRLKQKELEKTIFPIGELTKIQVREIAKKNKFPNYNKKSTVGICFIGKINLKKFLQKKIKPKLGKILDPKGNEIGKHDGIYYYTIGQRIGPRFGIEIKKNKETMQKWYVAKKDKSTNTIIAAPENHPILYRKEIRITNPYWINKDLKKIKSKLKVYARIRQVGELIPCTLYFDKKQNHFKVILKYSIKGVSTGQAIVLYKGTQCLGGGVIDFE
jgi:tRNA-uridine 2-sulfurtransferase